MHGTPLERFQELLRIPTMAGHDEAFALFAATLARLYPAVHAALELEVVGAHSLLFRWVGSGEADPLVLMAHQDVVPASDEGWTHPPFGAELTGEGDEQVLWSRGSLDDKGPLVAVLEAVERLLAAGFTPARDVYLSFGHDEETYGTGAESIVALLASRGVRAALVLDEGGAIVDDAFPGVTVPVAAVGVSEKGIANVMLSVRQEGGHASTPPRLAATVRLARAITRLEKRQFPTTMSPAIERMVLAVGRHAHGALGILFRGVRVTRPLVTAAFARVSDETRAMVRTTMAVTELRGSAAANVLAESASATVNVRIAVGSSVAEAERHIRRAIDDPRVSVSVEHASEPSPISPSDGAAWDAIVRSIEHAHPGTAVVPYVMYAASDARHFTRISDHVYRFFPFHLTREERATLHAIDERIHVATWLQGIAFYEELVRTF